MRSLFLLLPFLLWLFDLSLISELSFARLREVGGTVVVKLILLGVAWALLHHLIAGIRYLVLDMHIGIEKEKSRVTALWVYCISVPLTFVAALQACSECSDGGLKHSVSAPSAWSSARTTACSSGSASASRAVVLGLYTIVFGLFAFFRRGSTTKPGPACSRRCGSRS